MSAFTSGIQPRNNFPTVNSDYNTSSNSNSSTSNAVEEKKELELNKSSSHSKTVKPSKVNSILIKPLQGLIKVLGGGNGSNEQQDLPGGGERRRSSANNRRASVVKRVSSSSFCSKSLLSFILLGSLLVGGGLYFFKIKEKNTLILSELEIEKIWRWEIASGRYPSFKKTGITFTSLDSEPIVGGAGVGGVGGEIILNEDGSIQKPLAVPSIPNASTKKKQSISNPQWAGYGNGRERGGNVRVMSEGKVETQFIGIGQERSYLQVRPRVPYSAWSGVELSSYPKRPTINSVLDLDAVMDHCDFSTGKYVRDCLEALRLNAGLETGVRRGDMRLWEMTYVVLEDGRRRDFNQLPFTLDMPTVLSSNNFKNLLEDQLQRTLLQPTLYSSVTKVQAADSPLADQFCNPDYPRIFHIFWVGPFTDKPYAMALSFLYTQRLNLHLPTTTYIPNLCRPQLWIWINPGSASSSNIPNDPELANEQMLDSLTKNPWSAPLLHHRFQDSIKFKFWNTSEQLDYHVEMKGWRDMKLFSGQVHYGDNVTSTKTDRIGSASQNEYDRLSVDLADMARFLLCHRYGGIYLDADTILLRDWEELWGWKGSFGYRWSRLNTYNTAVLKIQKGSMIGSFIISMAVKNGLDFHPMHVAKYLKDAKLEGLLMRLPDALFDPAWLNVEDYQRDRPAFPFFKSFGDFFNASSSSAAPNAVGLSGFFQGAFSYHFHNFWWLPFDPSRNFPDLGARFMGGERIAKANNLAASTLLHLSKSGKNGKGKKVKVGAGAGADESNRRGMVEEEEEEKDLSWATVLKRTFESFMRGDTPNVYGEYIAYES